MFIFRSFLITISIQIEKSVDGVLGIRTRGRRMVGADETTELWRPPIVTFSLLNKNLVTEFEPGIRGIMNDALPTELHNYPQRN